MIFTMCAWYSHSLHNFWLRGTRVAWTTASHSYTTHCEYHWLCFNLYKALYWSRTLQSLTVAECSLVPRPLSTFYLLEKKLPLTLEEKRRSLGTRLCRVSPGHPNSKFVEMVTDVKEGEAHFQWWKRNCSYYRFSCTSSIKWGCVHPDGEIQILSNSWLIQSVHSVPSIDSLRKYFHRWKKRINTSPRRNTASTRTSHTNQDISTPQKNNSVTVSWKFTLTQLKGKWKEWWKSWQRKTEFNWKKVCIVT